MTPVAFWLVQGAFGLFGGLAGGRLETLSYFGLLDFVLLRGLPDGVMEALRRSVHPVSNVLLYLILDDFNITADTT